MKWEYCLRLELYCMQYFTVPAWLLNELTSNGRTNKLSGLLHGPTGILGIPYQRRNALMYCCFTIAWTYVVYIFRRLRNTYTRHPKAWGLSCLLLLYSVNCVLGRLRCRSPPNVFYSEFPLIEATAVRGTKDSSIGLNSTVGGVLFWFGVLVSLPLQIAHGFGSPWKKSKRSQPLSAKILPRLPKIHLSPSLGVAGFSAGACKRMTYPTLPGPSLCFTLTHWVLW